MRDAQARRKAPPQDCRIAAFENDRQGLIGDYGTTWPSAADLAASFPLDGSMAPKSLIYKHSSFDLLTVPPALPTLESGL